MSSRIYFGILSTRNEVFKSVRCWNSLKFSLRLRQSTAWLLALNGSGLAHLKFIYAHCCRWLHFVAVGFAFVFWTLFTLSVRNFAQSQALKPLLAIRFQNATHLAAVLRRIQAHKLHLRFCCSFCKKNPLTPRFIVNFSSDILYRAATFLIFNICPRLSIYSSFHPQETLQNTTKILKFTTFI